MEAMAALRVGARSGPQRAERSNRDCGNSGTTTRLLMGILAPWDIEVEAHRRRFAPAPPPHAPRFGPAFEDVARSFCPKAKTRCRLRFMARATSKRSITMRLLHRSGETAILLAGLSADGTTRVTELLSEPP